MFKCVRLVFNVMLDAYQSNCNMNKKIIIKKIALFGSIASIIAIPITFYFSGYSIKIENRNVDSIVNNIGDGDNRINSVNGNITINQIDNVDEKKELSVGFYDLGVLFKKPDIVKVRLQNSGTDSVRNLKFVIGYKLRGQSLDTYSFVHGEYPKISAGEFAVSKEYKTPISINRLSDIHTKYTSICFTYIDGDQSEWVLFGRELDSARWGGNFITLDAGSSRGTVNCQQEITTKRVSLD